MTKKRTTAQQRAREIQHAPGSRLTYGQALETARRPLAPDQAREVLRALAEDEHQDVSVSWRDRLRGHLAATQEADWPNMEHAVELSDDLFRLTGLPAPEDGLLGIPLALKFFPLARLHSAWEQGSTSDFACASVAALAGPLRHFLRHPHLQRPRQDDVVYRVRKAPTSGTARRQVNVHTVDGLYLEDVAYPRPWGAPSAHGYYSTATTRGREELARAVLAHALGGAAPTSLASCGSCHGNGWLTALDPGHGEHVPAYRPDVGPVCICANCHGTGLRPLPAGAFAAAFMRRLQASRGPAVSRSEILEWAAAHGPVPPAPDARCAEGLQGAYVQQAVAAVAAVGFEVGGDHGLEGYELDFDEQGVLGGHFAAGGELVRQRFGTDSILMMWSSDRGWAITGFGEVRRLLPAHCVPAPDAVAQALLEPAADEGDRWSAGVQRQPLDSDPYMAVLEYLV